MLSDFVKMLNNSGTYGHNEAPPNIVSSINRPQSNASTINHNFNDFGKFVHQATASASGYYDAHNYHNFGQPPPSMPPIMHPFQPYQNVGHGSPYLSQNTPYSYDSAVQSCFPVSTSIQSESYNNLLNFNQNFSSNSTPESRTISKKELYSPHSKGYPLNIPQIPLRLFQKSPTIDRYSLEPQNLTDNEPTPRQMLPTSSSPNPSVSPDIPASESTDVKNHLKLSSGTDPEQTHPEENNHKESSTIPEETITDFPENLSQKVDNPDESSQSQNSDITTIQKTTYNILKNTTKSSIFEKCLSESKRKSLEKTVRLIESILINSNTSRPETSENTVDPLAFSPKPDTTTNNIENCKNSAENADDVLTKRPPTKNKRKAATRAPKKIETTYSDEALEKTQGLNLQVEDIKVEPYDCLEVDYANPFHRDCNGILRDDIGNEPIINMDNSIMAAAEEIKTGSNMRLHYECPHCSLLLPHPKRFLVHVKWHSFGLINEKRAEMQRERVERTKEKREARKEQRLSATLASGEAGAPLFACKDCEQVFKSKSGLKNHRHKNHPTEVTACRICLAPVRDMPELRAHLTSHEAAGLHQCPECPKRFKYRHSLAKHADTHREKTHSCPVCGKLFGSRALVRLHMKTHERAARGLTHRCGTCGKGFMEMYNLQVHERTHRNEKPFKCDICESCFVTNSSLKRHIKVSHDGAKPHPCRVCQKCFASDATRDRHELRVHADPAHLPHACPHCPRRYMKAKDLRNHMYKQHPKTKKKSTSSDTEQISA